MRAIAVIFFLGACCLWWLTAAAPAPAYAADVTGIWPTLLAHGTEKHLWVASVEEDPTRPPPAFRTVIQSRILGNAWRPWGTLQGRITALGNRNTDLAVLFQGGQWVLFWHNNGLLTSSLGKPLPRSLNGQIIAMATDSQTVWVVALVNDAPSAATTASATRPAGATSRPATTQSTTTRASHRHPSLFSLRFDQWKWVNHGPIPAAFVSMDSNNGSLAVVDHRPVLAMVGPDDTFSVAQYGSQERAATTTTATKPATTQASSHPAAHWTLLPPIRAPFSPASFKPLGDSERPGPILLWIAPADGPGVIFTWTRQAWSNPIPLEMDGKAKLKGEKTIALAGQRLRLVSRDSATRSIMVRQFDLKGKPLGEQAALQTSDNEFGRIEFYMEAVLMAALVIAVIGTFQRRKQPPKPLPAERLPLASTGARLGAGMIDLAPVFAGIAVAATGLDPQAGLAAAELNPHMKWALWGVFAYLFYTTAVELIAGRTIGKMLLGLRVTTVEGRKADWSALLMRNILRIVDIWLAWIPLALIFYTPLRQRIGDIAAATVVVTKAPIVQDDPPSQDSDSSNSTSTDESVI